MTRSYIPLLAFLILLLLTMIHSFDLTTSVVSGWHTTVYPPYYIVGLIVSIISLFIAIGFWLFNKKTNPQKWILFAIHFSLTISAFIYLMVPTIFLNLKLTDQVEWIKAIDFRRKLIPVAWSFFLVGQIVFLFYYTGTIKANRITS